MKALRIGICGNGTVGGGTLQLLRAAAAQLERRAGRPLVPTCLGARRDRDDCPAGDLPVYRDLLEVARADDVDVLVECIGGTELARELVETALRHGKSVVTANKALIAEQGNELMPIAEAQGVSLRCEAAVAGGIPILKALREGMAGNRVTAVSGIINGTGNFILTAMGARPRSFADVLAEAQALGYAEADPSFDVEGVDAAHKLAILAAMAFEMPFAFPAVYCEGISRVTTADIEFARELGYRIKHLGIAKIVEAGVELRVHPTLVPADSLLATVDGVLNAVRLEGHAAGATVYSGAGAGREATASAVVADLVDIARAGAHIRDNARVHVPDNVPGNVPDNALYKEKPMPLLGVPWKSLRQPDIVAMDRVRSAWYLRLQAEDRPGVMSELANCLGAQGISIEALIQRPPKTAGDSVTVVRADRRGGRRRRCAGRWMRSALWMPCRRPHTLSESRCEGGVCGRIGDP